MKKVFTMLLLISILLSACSGINTNKGKEQILYKSIQDFVTLDPQVDLNVEVGFLAMHIFDRLVEYDRNGNIYPSILKSMPIVSEDGMTYTFELKPGIKFTNGDKLTSSDVKFTFERMLLPETNGKSQWILDSIKGAKDIMQGKTKELSGFKIIDDLKFEIKLEKPYIMFVQGLTTPYASIFPEKACRNSGSGWSKLPIGTGPFKVEKWEDHKEIILEKNDNYFGTKPHLDKIVNNIYEDNWDFAGMQAEYDLEKLDIIDVPPDKYQEYKSSPKYNDSLQVIQTLNTRYITLNNQNAILKDSKIRQAISISIDRNKICNEILKEASVPSYTIVPEKLDGYDESAYIEYNPEKAKSLLKEAGYPNGFRIDYFQANKNFLSMDYAIQIMLEQVGIKLNVIHVNEEELNTVKKEGRMTIYLSNWWADIPDADNFLYNLFYSKLNRSSKYNNHVFDVLCDEARVISDKERRKEIYKKLDRMVCREEWATIPISHNLESVLIRPNLKNAYINPITNLADFRESYKE